MLNVNPAVGELTVIVPVFTVQVGWAETLAMGAMGFAGGAFTVILVVAMVHPLVFFAVRV